MWVWTSGSVQEKLIWRSAGPFADIVLLLHSAAIHI